METAGAVRVLIVDDDFYARDALSALVARDARTRVWGAEDSVPAAVTVLAASADRFSHPDVVLLDVRLAEGERAGIEGIAAIRRAAPAARILITSVSSDDATVQAAVAAGADGYIWKNEAAERIATAVVRAAEGRFVLSKRIAESLVETLGNVGRYSAEVLPEGTEGVELTEAVRKTVYLFCVAGLSAREIADELQVSVSTVNKRIAAAYDALGATSRSEAFRRLVEGATS
ncbi:MAG: response regulator transcription factor [Coriobacteriia bacterium]|nr:response regulator transcription factor [Coriobacteriia bacterium]